MGGKGVLLFYIVWGELLLALRLRLCAQRLLTAGERDGSLWFFLPAAAALVLWMARGKLSAFARRDRSFWRYCSPRLRLCSSFPCLRQRGNICCLSGGETCPTRPGRPFRCWACWAMGCSPGSWWEIWKRRAPDGMGGSCGARGAAACWPSPRQW